MLLRIKCHRKSLQETWENTTSPSPSLQPEARSQRLEGATLSGIPFARCPENSEVATWRGKTVCLALKQMGVAVGHLMGALGRSQRQLPVTEAKPKRESALSTQFVLTQRRKFAGMNNPIPGSHCSQVAGLLNWLCKLI